MPRRLYLPLVLLAAASLVGDLVCRSLAKGGEQERLLESAGKAIGRLPDKIGPWKSQPGEPLTADVLRMLDCRAHESRVYVDEATGDQVGFMLLAGTAGPLVAHTAEVCYGSVNFDISEPPHAESIRGTGARSDVFQQVTFRSGSVAGQKQRVYYAWRKFDGLWKAPDNPRLELGGHPMLYKLQLSGSAPLAAGDSSDSDPARRFLTDLLPVLDTLLKAD